MELQASCELYGGTAPAITFSIADGEQEQNKLYLVIDYSKRERKRAMQPIQV